MTNRPRKPLFSMSVSGKKSFRKSQKYRYHRPARCLQHAAPCSHIARARAGVVGTMGRIAKIITMSCYKDKEALTHSNAFGYTWLLSARLVRLILLTLSVFGKKQIIFTAFWSKVLDFFYNWYIDSVCEDKALHQV